MESVGSKKQSNLLTKLNYLHHILRYYGWVDQCAYMLTSLCKQTHKLWNDNLEWFTNVVFKDSGYFRKVLKSQVITEKFVEYILKGNK